MLASVAGHASISGEGGSGSNGHRRFIRWKQAPLTQEIDVKNGTRSPRKQGSRRMYMNDRKIEQTMEIDELPENDERLLKKPEIKRDEMA
jgi:hypothetical protein